MTGHTGCREQVRPATVKQRTLAPQRPKDKYDCKVDPLLSLSHRTHDRPSKGRAENTKSTGRTLQLPPVEDVLVPPHMAGLNSQTQNDKLLLWQKMVFNSW